MPVPYSKNDRRKKSYPCSFEGCEQVFDSPGKLLEHEDKHENGSIVPGNVATSEQAPVDKSSRLPYSNERPGEIREVELPDEADGRLDPQAD